MSLNVVIVDDAGFIREIIHSATKSLGHHVVGEARSGDEAIEVARNTSPDLIFMDLVLPGLGGIEAIRQIREFLPDVKIAACSSITEQHFQNKALEAGCFMYVVKPFKKSDLQEVFRKARVNLRAVANG